MTVATSSSAPGENTPLLGTSPAGQDHSHEQDNNNLGTRPSGTDGMPLAIAHRGYSAVAPENSMLAFHKAVEAGAHGIETDLHLSKDGIVVLTHDFSLKRTFGLDSNCSEHDWGYLSTLRTVRKPHEPMIRLEDLLRYLAEPEQEHVVLMLDIKRDDDAETLMRNTAAAIASVPAKQPWSERIILCCWTAVYIRLSRKYLPEFRLANVTWSPLYAGAVAKAVPGIGLSVHQYALYSPVGQFLMRRARRSGNHPLYSWTVNEENWMEWAIGNKLTGIITDDVKLYLEVCQRYRRETNLQWARRRFTLQDFVRGARAYGDVLRFLWMFFGGKLKALKAAFDPRSVEKDLHDD